MRPDVLYRVVSATLLAVLASLPGLQTAAQESPAFGAITGSLGFPSEGLPPMRVYAISADSQRTDSMSAFWEKFKAAAIKGDKETVAALSQFPISMGYGIPSVKNKAQLMKYYRKIFFGETNAAKCFPKARPVVEKSRPKEFTIGCAFAGGDNGGGEPFEYTFALTRNGWRFTGFQNINE